MLERVADLVVWGVLGLAPASAWGEAAHFFLYDLLKVGLLLVTVTLLMGAVKVWLPLERMRDLIASGRLRGLEHPAAAVFGAATPFCSCSSIPLFIGFLQAGIPIGVTFSFLITSPLVNEVAVALMLGLFGWKVTAVYAGAGLLLGTGIGWILGRFDLEPHVEAWVRELREEGKAAGASASDGRSLVRQVTDEAGTILRQVAPYVVLGLALAAGIHGFVPTAVIEKHAAAGGPLAVPAAVLVAVPLYAGAAGVVPVVEALVAKGVPLGTSLAFMMGTVGLSLPEGMLLKKVMRPRLLATFFVSVALAIVAVGYGFNWLF